MTFNIQGQVYPAPQQFDVPPSYQRPADWLVLPPLEEGEEKFVGLFAVFDVIGNYLALQFEGDYVVDWGDGTVENVLSGVKAEHSYNYSSLPPDCFCSRGYKQVLVTVVPQVESFLTSMDLTNNHSEISPSISISIPWLDITLNIPNAGSGASLKISYFESLPSPLDLYRFPAMLERFTLYSSGSCSSLESFFGSCASLQDIRLLSLPNVDNMSRTFEYCSSLQYLTLPNCPAIYTGFLDTLSSEVPLKVFVGIGFPSAQELNSLLKNSVCKYAAIYNVPVLQSLDYSFSQAVNLQVVDLPEIPSVTSCYYGFSYCYSLEQLYVPVNTGFENPYAITYGEYSLQALNLGNTTSVTDFTYAFGQCYSLVQAPVMDCSQALSFDYTWYECPSLTYFPGEMFESCTQDSISFSSTWEYGNLDSKSVDSIIIGLDESGTIGGYLDMTRCGSNPSRAVLYGALSNLIIKEWDLEMEAMYPYYQPKYNTTCMISNFTDKEFSLQNAWQYCYLSTFPLINTSNTVVFNGAWFRNNFTSFPEIDTGLGLCFFLTWRECDMLEFFPALDFSRGLFFQQCWYGCSSLTEFPFVDFSSGRYFNNCWYACSSLTTFPAGVFDNCSAIDFADAWVGCALSKTSVDNILISLDTAGKENGIVNLDGGTSSSPGPAGLAAKASLEAKGWTVTVNAPLNIYCTPAYPSDPVTYPPYSCNTAVNTAGVTDFSTAWKNCTPIVVFPCVDASSVTNFTEAWSGCVNMTTFPQLNTTLGTSFSYAWESCYVLNPFPEIDTSAGTDFSGAWSYCYALNPFPALDTSSGTNFAYAWSYNTSLTTFPFIDTSQGTDFTFAWYYCDSLTTFPLLNTGSATSLESAWGDCTNLTSFPLIDTSQVTNFKRAWFVCTGLTSFPLLNTSSGTNFNSAWDSCIGLTSFPLLNTSSGTDFGGAWATCSGLTSFPLINTSNGTDFGRAWMSCSGLTSFPALNLSNGTNFVSSWYNCTQLATFPANMFNTCSATDFTFAWLNCGLTRTSVDNILISLDTAGQSNGIVNLDGGTSSSPGPAGLAAKASLEAKGWTVTVNAPF
jgi:hypothetical protein